MHSLIPSISVIVPVYNVEHYIEKCVESLLEQTIKNIEIILVDDESTDNSSIICDEYAEKYNNVKTIHKKNGGLGSARNAGLEIASGEFVGFVDSDDYVSKDMYERLLNIAINNQADCAYCTMIRFWKEEVEKIPISNNMDSVEVYEDDTIINSYLLDRIGLQPQSKEDCSYGASVCVGIFKRNIIQDNSIKFVSERELISEDMIFDIEFIPHCERIVHINFPMYFYRFNPNSLTTKYVADRFERNIVLWQEMKLRLEKIYSCEEIYNRLYRYFITFTRISLIEEIVHLPQNSWSVAKKNIVRILNNEKLQEVLQAYPIKQMPFIQRVFFSVVKKRLYLVVAILVKINLIIKNNR